MVNYVWQIELENWLKKYKEFPRNQHKNAINFFEKTFKLFAYPDKAWFGIHTTRASLVVGQLYVAAIHKQTGNSQGIWLLLDSVLPFIDDMEFCPVKSTLKSQYPLQWGLVKSYDLLPELLDNKLLWDSFILATTKVIHTYAGADRNAVQIARGKHRLTDIFNPNESDYFRDEIVFAEQVNRAKHDSPTKRRRRLLLANSKPPRIKREIWIFSRNPDVVAEVLERAKGFCEACDQPAPFLKRFDSSPYLEVHHRQPLAEGGDDTVENAIALCPNCHRKAHYG